MLRLRFPRIFWPMLLSLGLLLVSAPNCDIWWHLQVGRDICHDGVWPSPDIYSYTTDRPWVIHSWLADCFFYVLWSGTEWVYEGAGDLVLSVLRLVLLGVFCVAVYLLARHSSQNETIGVIVALCAAALTWAREIRPFLITPLLMLYMYTFFTQRQPSRKDWFLVPASMLVWANLHGGFAIAAVIILCAVVAHLLAGLASVKRYHSWRWVVLSLAAVVATLVNPEPIHLLSRVLQSSSAPSLDWRSLPWWLREAPLGSLNYVMIYAVVLVAWIYGLLRERPNRPTLLSAKFITEMSSFALAFLHVRFVWMLVIPLLASCKRLQAIFPPENNLRWTPALLLFIVFFLLEIPPPATGVFRLPTESMDYFVQGDLQGNVFAPWQWGGYITWRSNKKAQVFVDTRIEPFTTREIALSGDVGDSPARYLGVLQEYGTELLIMPIDDREPEWHMLAEKGLIDILHKNNNDFVARIHPRKVQEIYAARGLGRELALR
jgi:hypothetical protein